MSRIDLGKLIKQVDDTHAGFHSLQSLRQWGTGKSLTEKRLYMQIKQRHHAAVEGQVSFNPLELYRIRRLANKYLRRFGEYRS